LGTRGNAEKRSLLSVIVCFDVFPWWRLQAREGLRTEPS
jgi:hypothetical protein